MTTFLCQLGMLIEAADQATAGELFQKCLANQMGQFNVNINVSGPYEKHQWVDFNGAVAPPVVLPIQMNEPPTLAQVDHALSKPTHKRNSLLNRAEISA